MFWLITYENHIKTKLCKEYKKENIPESTLLYHYEKINLNMIEP